MLPLSTKEPVRFTPEGEGAPTYLIRVPTPLSRADFYKRLTATGAFSPQPQLLYARLIDGIRAVVAQDQQAELIGLVEQAEAADGRLPKDLALKLADVEAQIRPYHPPYAALLAEQVYYAEVLPVVACQCFLAGMERGGKAEPLEFSGGVLSEAQLAALDPAHVREVGWKAFSLTRLDRGLEKNSASPSPSPSSPATSTAGKGRRTAGRAGKSSGSSTKRTRGSS